MIPQAPSTGVREAGTITARLPSNLVIGGVLTTVTRFEGFVESNTTPVPDEFFDYIAPQLGEAELRVMLYVFRRTRGFKKTSDAISLGQFINGIKRKSDGQQIDYGCGLTNRTTIMSALRSLSQRGLIVIHTVKNEDGGNAANVYSLRWRDPSTANVLPPSTPSALPLVRQAYPQETVDKKQSEQSSLPQPGGGAKIALSFAAHRVLNEHRNAYGLPRPIKVNPTVAARLEQAIQDYGEDVLKKAVNWMAEKNIAKGELITAIRAAKTIAAGNGNGNGGGNERVYERGRDSTKSDSSQTEKRNPFAAWDD